MESSFFGATVNIYCERTDGSWLAEPVNVATNLAFLLVAVDFYRRQDISPSRSGQVKTLAMLLAVVGLCSALFHVTAFRWAGMLDSASIAVFVLSFLYTYTTGVLLFKHWQSLLALMALLAVTALLATLFQPQTLNGSEVYFGILLALIGISSLTKNQDARRLLNIATLVFVISIGARTLDIMVCDSFPLGTHFIWHLLNGVVAYFAIESYILSTK